MSLMGWREGKNPDRVTDFQRVDGEGTFYLDGKLGSRVCGFEEGNKRSDLNMLSLGCL